MTMWQGASAGRGSPGRGPIRALARLALVALAIVAIAQEGCRSGGCSSCGLRSRIFNRRGAVAEPVLTDPGTTMSGSSVMGTPPGTLVPNGTGSSAISEPEGDVKALPETPPAGNNGATNLKPKTTSSVGSNDRSNYETARGRNKPAGGPRDTVARLLPAEKKNSAARAKTLDSSARVSNNRGDADSENPLDHLAPPLDLPEEMTGKDQEPLNATDVAVADEPAPKPVPESAATAGVEPAKTQPKPDEHPPLDRAKTMVSLLPPSEAPAAPVPHFNTVLPTLAGGGAPSNEGLDWLVEKGYKTLLDLREPAEVQPAFIGEVSKRGLRYLALPITLETLDGERLDRFQKEIGQADARPLYFFDNDGSRAGALWFIRSMTQQKDKVDLANARREARELGLTDNKLWTVAESFVHKVMKPKSQDSANPAASKSDKDQDPKKGRVVEPVGSANENALASAHAAFNWQPYLAMLATILGVPLAFWSRSGFPLRTILRASLPATAQRPRSLPSE